MKKNRRHIARITLLAFLLNVFLPFFAYYEAPARPPEKALSALLGEKVLICTGDGFKWASWEELQSGKEKRSPPSHYKCPLCYLAAHGLKDLVTPGAIALADIKTGGARPAVYDYHPPALSLQSSLHSRAPPSSLL